MNREIWRLTQVVAISLFAGIVTDHLFACLSAGLIVYLLWCYRRLRELLQHLRDRDCREDHDFDGVIEDILWEFDRARAHHQDRSRNLLSHLKRFQIATTALPDAVVLLGENGRIDWANDKARDYLGVDWPADEGQRIANLLRDPRLTTLLKEPDGLESDDRLELTLLLNEARYLEFRTVPYGEEQRLLVARDVTEIHKTNQMRRDFIANASHELRTPLTVIAGYLESLDNERDDVPVSTWSGIISKMRAHTARMQRLIDDLLKLSALESERRSGQGDEEVMVSELLSVIFNEAKTLSGELGHIFYLETNPDLWLRGNQQELYSAFSNLVFNAVQYTPEKGVIRVRWYAKEDYACMEVTDSGEGIAGEHIPRLTERFYRVDTGRSRDKGGTGLGLAIVKHVLVNHNAGLNIRSEPGKGSTFQCVFPKQRLVFKPASDEASLSA